MSKFRDEALWGKIEAGKLTRGPSIGVNSKSNLREWAQYAHQNREPGQSKAQAKHDLRPAGRGPAEVDWSDTDWHVPQHAPENDRGWAPINSAAKPNTFTGPGGSKRGD
jgi:hypothetical protein